MGPAAEVMSTIETQMFTDYQEPNTRERLCLHLLLTGAGFLHDNVDARVACIVDSLPKGRSFVPEVMARSLEYKLSGERKTTPIYMTTWEEIQLVGYMNRLVVCEWSGSGRNHTALLRSLHALVGVASLDSNLVVVCQTHEELMSSKRAIADYQLLFQEWS
eukprot:NODE_3143_length_810_cov_89.038108_g2618_i0.p1 GENE.NODE_3143_length_810_cov_89.038108_g2618_i0~~NODE_3143_length_810_cov_89.038108_g2618_i0.p1  ORF type:complete len:161 (+),score=35.49 NODE_3143_length_810_cov_89.038108_g2618_i0:207-689(+)